MNSKNYVLLWILIVVIFWIGLAYLLATMAVIAIPFQDIFLQNLTDIRIFAISAFLGTIVTGIIYAIDRFGFHKYDNSA
jgi:hypothetical protein